MSDNDGPSGFLNRVRQLGGAWADSTYRRLQARGSPQTQVDSGGSVDSYSFEGQEIDRSELRDVKEMREGGGVVSHLVHAKAMMFFGPGASFEAENDDAAEWLHEQFHDLDNLLIDLGEDATWFPYSAAEIVETQGGDFSHIELVEPWTLEPVTNKMGEVIAWEQYVKSNGWDQEPVNTFEPDEIATFILNKCSGRDKTGISEVLRAEDEITNYKQNQKTVNDALEYLVPHNHWIVGREGGTVINDNELRRVRNMVQDMEGDTQFITGPDVQHESIDLSSFDVKEITENDLRQLAVALGVPIELASVISEGLGSGEQSSVREQYFELERQAKQRSLGGQFVEEIARILLRDYSEFDPDQNLDLRFDETKDNTERKQIIDSVGDDMTVNERRDLYDMAPLDDESRGEQFESPAQEESDDPEGGLFQQEVESALDDCGLSQERELETYDDYPEAAQENARMALEAREETGNPNNCGTRVGWERANQLDNGESLSEETISRMAAFERHEDNKEQGEEGRADCGWLMWKAWGGDEGIEWAQDKLDEIEASGGSGNVQLADGNRHIAERDIANAPEWDQPLLELHQRVWTADTSKNLLQFNPSETPEFVKERIRDAIWSGALFSDIESIPSSERNQLKEFLTESLSDDNWTIDGVADQIEQLGVSGDRAELIARTEVASTINTARAEGYQERDDVRGETFYWSGSTQAEDSRTTDACDWLIKKTNPFHGGEPVSMDRLKELIAEAPTHDPDMDDNLARPDDFVVHPGERKTFTRHVSE
jgi:hypothetical protein